MGEVYEREGTCWYVVSDVGGEFKVEDSGGERLPPCEYHELILIDTGMANKMQEYATAAMDMYRAGSSWARIDDWCTMHVCEGRVIVVHTRASTSVEYRHQCRPNTCDIMKESIEASPPPSFSNRITFEELNEEDKV